MLALEYIGEGMHRIAYRLLFFGKPSGLVLKLCKKRPVHSCTEMKALEYWKNDPLVAPHLPTVYFHDEQTGSLVMQEYAPGATRRSVRHIEAYLRKKLSKQSIVLRPKNLGLTETGSVVLLDMGEMLPKGLWRLPL